ncbi:uncharacterized protein LOC115788606 [Archocentrus centrarchus]|uniref:uncharacterized protein LOC115788606 n=1 Tax=Archocentrus centrarchus TaxID=63155 RepID=UPI0011E9E476|nr:uncharacterized protein LOC115788606 [Archocentrus centrarchus]
MACGVGLGMLLIFLVQAEHVCCSWATQARSPQTHNSNGYVGLSQQDGRLRRLHGSYSQNQIRQASISPHSAQSSSLSTGTAVNRGYSQGLSTSSYEQTVSKPVQSSVRLVQSSLVSKPTWYTNLEHVSAQEVPNRSPFGLSSAVASGNSVNQLSQNQNSLTDARKYISSSSTSLQTPRESYSHQLASQWSGAQKPASAAVQMQTSASAPARRVSKHKSRPSSVSFDRAITRNVPIQTAAGKPYQNQWLPVNVGNTQGSYMPSSTSNMKVSYNPSYTSLEQRPTSRNPLQASWGFSNIAQGARNLPVYGSDTVGNSTWRFAPSRTYEIPERFGGYAIRRLSELKEEVVQKPQTATSPPKQMAYLNPSNSEQLYTRWIRLKLHPRKQN